MLKTPHEDEKEKCRKIIDRLEKELKNWNQHKSLLNLILAIQAVILIW